MEFQVKILLLSFFATVILAIAIIPILKKLKIGQTERDDGPESHMKKQGTPTMGGIIIMIAIIVSAVGGLFYYFGKEAEAEVAKNMLPLLFITFGFGLIGFIDDFKKLVLKNTTGLKPAYKMIGLLIISVIYVLYIEKYLNLGTETFIPFLKVNIDIPFLIYMPFAIFVILGTTNAINLTDGVDGLAASVTAIIVTFLTVIAILFEVKEMVVYGSLVIGSVIGFLLFNLHTAKVFMGDTGSLLLGGVISAMALYLKIPFILIIVAIVPILETLSVMAQVTYFKKTGKRIFKMAPLHHHLELSGWRESRVVSTFSIITLVACIIGMMSIL